MSIESEIAYVQKIFDDHADLNGDPRDVIAYVKGDDVWTKGPHKITREDIHIKWEGATRA